MAISAVNAVSFKGKAVTDQGNEYNTCNVGKYTGAGIGAAGTVYGAIQAKKGYSFISQMEDAIKSAISEVAEQVDPESTKESVAESLEGVNIMKPTKKYGIIGVAILGTLVTLGGLGLGTLVDGGINLFRAHKADKQTDANKTDIQA